MPTSVEEPYIFWSVCSSIQHLAVFLSKWVYEVYDEIIHENVIMLEVN